MSFIELFFRGGQVTGLGMLAVFAIIAVIFIVIKALGATSGSEKKVVSKAEEPTVEDKSAPVAAEEAAEEATGNDLELIAILAAAVSAYSGEPVTKFRVVSFKHIK